MMFSRMRVCVRVLLSYNNTHHLGSGPTLLQGDLILTKYICKQPRLQIRSQAEVLGERTSHEFLGTQFSPLGVLDLTTGIRPGVGLVVCQSQKGHWAPLTSTPSLPRVSGGS